MLVSTAERLLACRSPEFLVVYSHCIVYRVIGCSQFQWRQHVDDLWAAQPPNVFLCIVSAKTPISISSAYMKEQRLNIGMYFSVDICISLQGNYCALGEGSKYRDECAYLSLSLLASLEKHTDELHQIFHACYMWPSLGPLWRCCDMIMHFRFCGWLLFSRSGPMVRHVRIP